MLASTSTRLVGTCFKSRNFRSGQGLPPTNLMYECAFGAKFARLMCSSKKQPDPSPSVERSATEDKSTEKSLKAKAKLNDLLLNIVKEGEKRRSTEVQVSGESKPLSNTPQSPPKPSSTLKSKKKQPEEIKLGKRVLAAVKQVAETMGEDAEKIENELVEKMKSHSPAASKARLSELLTGMSVEPNRHPAVAHMKQQDGGFEAEEPRRRSYPRTMDRPFPRRSTRSDGMQSVTRKDLFEGRRLGIFSSSIQSEDNGNLGLATWDKFQARNLELAVTHPPCNGFEEMIMWTNQGKLWKYPIDNEQDLDEELAYSFEDHVFLEPLIDSWCPKVGPLRTFMHLVCTALSKNAYLTVPEKHEYIAWYYEYFKEKQVILREIGLGEIKTDGNSASISAGQ